jgi:sialic acid synthase SpsE
MVRQIRELEAARSAPKPGVATPTARDWALQAVVAARDLDPGTVLAEADVAFKRPGLGGVPAADVDSLLGRTLVRGVPADEQIRLDDVE